MTPAQELLTSIQAKRFKQAKLLAELDLWAAVQAQGIDISTVATFGFKSEWPRPNVYNSVRHKDGTITRLQPSLRAP